MFSTLYFFSYVYLSYASSHSQFQIRKNDTIGEDYYWYQKANLLGLHKAKTVHLHVLHRDQLHALSSSPEDLQVARPKSIEKTTDRPHLPTHPHILLKDSYELDLTLFLGIVSNIQHLL